MRCALAFGLLAMWSAAAMLGVVLRIDVLRTLWSTNTTQYFVVHGVLLSLLMLAIADHRLRIRRLKRTLDESGGLACGYCGHSLRMVSDSGRCSECGKVFDVELLQSYWRRLFAPRWRRDPRPLRASRASIVGLFFIAIMPAWGIVHALTISRYRAVLPWWEHMVNLLMGYSSYVAILVFAWWLLFELGKRQIARRVWHCGFAVCGRCGQPLKGDADPVFCRRCGTKYDRGELRAAWLRDCPAHWRIEGQDL